MRSLLDMSELTIVLRETLREASLMSTGNKEKNRKVATARAKTSREAREVPKRNFPPTMRRESRMRCTATRSLLSFEACLIR